MPEFSAETFVVTLALIGGVVIVAALLSGVIDRTGLPQVALFLALGAALGPAGLGLVGFTLESAALRTVATLALVLVLFSDAVSLDRKEVARHGRLAALVLGPGTLVSAALTALAAWWLLDLEPAPAAILGAALASTDPVMMRGLLRRSGVPPAARHALGMESGLNDVVLLPVVLVAMVFLDRATPLTGTDWSRLGLDLFLLGPGAGVAVGLVGIGVLDLVRRRFGVRRDYESLYALGVALAAYAAAEAVHGSGFLAAFAAGFTIAALDVELCVCFLDYGQATSEMFLLFTFVAFGSGLIWTGLGVATGPAVLFAVLAILIRTAALWLALLAADLDRTSRRLIVWFGPKGLSSLLLVLLPAFAGYSGGEALFAYCALVVLFSVALHGGALPFLARAFGRGANVAPPPPPPPPPPAPGPPAPSGGLPVLEAGAGVAPTVASAEKITMAEFQALRAAGAPAVLLDVRSVRSWANADRKAAGAIRVPPDDAALRASELALPRNSWLVGYCT